MVAAFTLSFLVITFVKQKVGESEPKKTVLRFQYDTYDFQILERFSPSRTYFYFTNEGNHPLKINKIESICGCTIPEWPKLSIGPGEKDSILVTFDASELGLFHRNVIVYSNAISSPDVLYIKGEVQAAIE